MATKIKLDDGTVVTRAWDGRQFRFEIVSAGIGKHTVVMRPTTYEAKELSILFNGDDITGKQEVDR